MDIELMQEKQGFVEPKPKDDYNSIFYRLIELVIPNILTSIVQTLTDFLPYYFIGLLNDVRYTGAIGLSITWFNICSYSVILGCCSTIDTLVSQSYGQKRYKDCGIHLFRGSLTIFFISFALAYIQFKGGICLYLLGVDKEIADLAGQYLTYLIPNLFLIGQYEILKKFLNAQTIVAPTTVVTFITTFLHPVWCYVFIFYAMNGSFLGAALAKNFTTLLSLILLLGYVKFSDCCKETWPKCYLNSNKEDWHIFFKLSIPGILMIGLDWWAYEIMNIISGLLGKNELSVNVALSNINMLIFMIPTGIGASACALVGNSIGAKDIKSAKKTILVSSLMSSICMITILIILTIFRKYIAYYFFPSESLKDVIDLFCKVFFILALSEIFDTLQGTLSRILVGMGKQTIATIAIIIAYYIVMIPSAILLVFILKYGLYGLWVANTLAAFTLASIYAWILIWNINWEALILASEEMAIKTK